MRKIKQKNSLLIQSRSWVYNSCNNKKIIINFNQRKVGHEPTFLFYRLIKAKNNIEVYFD